MEPTARIVTITRPRAPSAKNAPLAEVSVTDPNSGDTFVAGIWRSARGTVRIGSYTRLVVLDGITFESKAACPEHLVPQPTELRAGLASIGI